MKKLIMAGAIVCASVIAQAASVDWKVSGASSDVGAVVYMLTSIETQYDSVEAIAAASIDTATVAKNGRVYNTGDKTTAGVTASQMATTYFLIVSEDGKSFNYLSKDISSFVYDPAAQETSPGLFSDFTVSAIKAGTSGAINVPEPTSGLLMLLGLAGLALKRKRA